MPTPNDNSYLFLWTLAAQFAIFGVAQVVAWVWDKHRASRWERKMRSATNDRPILQNPFEPESEEVAARGLRSKPAKNSEEEHLRSSSRRGRKQVSASTR